jgi:hypothetical protein
VQVPDPELAPADHLLVLIGHQCQHAGKFVVQGGNDGCSGHSGAPEKTKAAEAAL